MNKYILAVLLFSCLCVTAQQVAFQRSYQKGNNAYITTFTELKSTEIVAGYTLLHLDTTHVNPNTMELHLLKLDKNGNEMWDKLVIKDTTRFTDDRFTIQNIDEQDDGSLLFDITYPYGEKYLAKYDGSGNALWNTYLHNSFGDYNISTQLIKQRGQNIALPDGSALSVGASFQSIAPKATLSIVQAGGLNPLDLSFYTGYFNEAYYLNSEHLYTLGVEQAGTQETLVFSDIRMDGGVNYHLKTVHTNSEKIITTALLYTNSKIRVAESISKNDTSFSVNIYEYTLSGNLTAVTSHKLKCAASCINLGASEVTWVLSNQCNAETNQTIVKYLPKSSAGFTFSNSFDNVLQLKKLHDDSYAFTFIGFPGLNFWKLNIRGTLQSGTSAEGLFAPNPAKDYTTFIGNTDTYNHALTIKLCDMLGNTVRNYYFESMETATLNLRNLREGVYAYHITTDAGVKLKGKIVIYQKN